MALTPPPTPGGPAADVAVIGAGAAGLATAIFTKRRAPGARVLVLEGARRPGAKILVSGGTRCNVTNSVVTEADFNGGRPAIIRRILRALPVAETIEFFREVGVGLHEEPYGKLFPDTHRSRDVVDALLREVARTGAELCAGHRVHDVARAPGGFRLRTSQGEVVARSIVLATGGLSLPKTGSDGWGYDVAARFGHSRIPTTPALVPLLLDGTTAAGAMARALSGVSQDVRIDVRVRGTIAARIEGPLLWTHVGISGPAALDVSRHWLRARVDGDDAAMTASLCPTESFESLEPRWIGFARDRPRLTVASALATQIPASAAAAVLGTLDLDPDRTLAELSRDARRRLVHALVAWPLPVTGSRGYNHAEVTAGGVPLAEIEPATMASRLCAGLYLVGEILDVDGRLGGFNFQWAWSSARVAGDAIGAEYYAR
jgi:predicted Rossmann fold flavoprotein